MRAYKTLTAKIGGLLLALTMWVLRYLRML